MTWAAPVTPGLVARRSGRHGGSAGTTLGDVVIDLYTEERPRGEIRPAHLSAGALFSPRRSAFSAQSPAWTGWSFWADGAATAQFIGPLVEKFVSEEQPFSASGVASRVAGACGC